ncbi:MarR family transcriptional regulator [Seohaeicola saemankumensis]|jgi:DNA-binding MarR family transcriptional regulator|uniref:MarR family winged helix-turn-helix transcriptional regulator n=1 Tax=Seohaeicola saemankumensis TaxID=481181 RepID=UPI001E62E464|nr:MarR family transcriptional regulator [Seohaeicola saemankumensis]MCD1627677.1 MarR family transcriptional regulator [Seohaeicola saemankumensis]
MGKKSKLNDLACFQVYTLHHAFGRYYQAAFAESGLTYAKYIILKALATQSQMSLSELSQGVGVEPNTISPLAKKMATYGVIERVRDAEDERRIVLRLTEYGIQVLKAADEVVAENFADLGISDNDAKQAIALISRIRSAVEKAKPSRLNLPQAPPNVQDGLPD